MKFGELLMKFGALSGFYHFIYAANMTFPKTYYIRKINYTLIRHNFMFY